MGGRSCVVAASVLDSDIAVNEFELQSYCHIHFQNNVLVESINSLISDSDMD